jgi:hypothetical protein
MPLLAELEGGFWGGACYRYGALNGAWAIGGFTASSPSPPPERCSWTRPSPSPRHSQICFSPRLRPQPPGKGSTADRLDWTNRLVNATAVGEEAKRRRCCTLSPHFQGNRLNRSGPKDERETLGVGLLRICRSSFPNCLACNRARARPIISPAPHGRTCGRNLPRRCL